MVSTKAAAGVVNADMTDSYLALNYGNRVDEYLIDTLEYNRKYTASEPIIDLAYFRVADDQDRMLLNLVTENYRYKMIVGSTGGEYIGLGVTPLSINSNPNNVYAISSTNSNTFLEFTSLSYRVIEGTKSSILAKYSYDGDYIIADYKQTEIGIWKDGNLIQKFNDWSNNIVDIGESEDILAVID